MPDLTDRILGVLDNIIKFCRSIKERVDALENSHPPIDLAPAIDEIIKRRGLVAWRVYHCAAIDPEDEAFWVTLPTGIEPKHCWLVLEKRDIVGD